MDLRAAQPDVLLLVGTQTGNSETVADAIGDRLAALGFDVHLVDMAEAYPEMLADYGQLVCVTCTWSEGTYPDNAKDFGEALPEVAPELSGLRYGIVGLGDREYDPYYQTAAIRLGDTLSELGATALVERHDIDGGPSAEQIEGAAAWAERLAAAFAAAP